MIRGFLPKSVFMSLICLTVVSCGGGSGTTSTTGSTGSSGTSPTMTLRLVRVATDGTETTATTLDPSRSATAIATISNASAETIVTFTSSLGILSPTSGTALSSSGVAKITLQAGSIAGAGQITASATINGNLIQSNAVAFEVLAFDEVEEELALGTCSSSSGDPLDCVTSGFTFTAGQMNIDLDTLTGEPADGLAAQGTAEIAFVVMDITNGAASATPVSGVSVTITSRCTGLGIASISQEQSGTNGVVRATYQAEAGCEDTDSITASIASTSATASGSIFVFPARVGSIIFDSVVDSLGAPISTIFIQESGGESTARVIFQVLDRFGSPKADQDVTFELTTSVGGLKLQNASRKTDSEGKAVAFVNAGFIATTVRVRASLNVDTDNNGTLDTTLVTLSDQLSVNTGIADQNSLSISATLQNVEGDQFDGQQATISVALSDAFNNPVPAGTTVQFRTEYGRVTPTCATGATGNCSVTWNSQEPRTPLDPTSVIPTLGDTGVCPTEFIYEEAVTISDVGGDGTLDGDTQYVVSSVRRVETVADVALTVTTDFTVDADGSGITCVAGSATCVDAAALKISYNRQYLDEDASGDTTHTISRPGVATAPFTQQDFVPCLAAQRVASTVAPGYLGGLGQIHGGRSRVLAFAQGEESFTDSNGNGQYDFGEPFVDLPEAFLDVNEDNVFGNPGNSGASTLASPSCYGPDAPLATTIPALNLCYQEGGDEDIFIDFQNDGVFNKGNGIYNGTLCPKAISDRTTTCVGKACTINDRYCTRTLVNIRRSITILSAGSDAFLSFRDSSTGELISSVDLRGDPAPGTFDTTSSVTRNDGSVIAAGTDFSVGFGDTQVRPGIGELVSLRSGNAGVRISVADIYNGRMPATTGISLTSDSCVLSTASVSVNSSNGFGGTQFSLVLTAAESPITDSGTVQVSVTTPQSVLTGPYTLGCAY